MEKSISVRVMGREYTLRVNEEDEAMTKEIAAYVDDKMTAFRTAFPKQPEITTAVIAALAIAEELYGARDQQDKMVADTDEELVALADKLSFVMDMDSGAGQENGQAPEKAKSKKSAARKKKS